MIHRIAALPVAGIGLIFIAANPTEVPQTSTASSSLSTPSNTNSTSTAKPALSIAHDANKRAVNLGFEAKQTDRYYLLEGRTELDKGDWSLSYGIKGDGQAKTTPMPAQSRMGFYRLTRVEDGHAMLAIDHDDDLLPTGFEINSGLNPASRSGNKDTLIDPDKDGSNNLLEYRRGTNPQKNDTDQDGVNDAEDAVGYDPAFTFKAAPETVYRVIDLGERPTNSRIEAVNNRGTVILKKSYSQFTLRQLGKTARNINGQFVDLNNKDDYIHTYGLKHYLNGSIWYTDTRKREFVDGTKKNLDNKRTLLGIEDSGRIWYRQINEFSRDIKQDKNYQILRGYSAGTFHTGGTLAGSTHTFTWHKSTTKNEEGEVVVDFDRESTSPVYQAQLNQGLIAATAGSGSSMIGSTAYRLSRLRNNGDHASYYFTVTSDTFVLRGNAPGHTFSDGYSLAGRGVYTIGRLPGQSGLWKSWKGEPRLSLGAPQSGQAIRNGPGGDALHVLSIADNGLLLTREESTHTQPAKLWRNGRLLTDAEILGPDSLWSQLNILQISDNGVFIAAMARGTDEKWHNLLLVPESSLVLDWNRDGAIADADRKRATESAPFRFWVNDDDDVDETSGDDRPGSGSADHSDALVDSSRDLVDFFPVFIDLKDFLGGFDDLSGITVKLRQEDSALNFVYTDLQPADAGDYLRKSNLQTGYGPAFDSAPGTAATHPVTSEGTTLSTAFLKKIRDEGKGVLLFEGAKASTQPLVLELSYTGSTPFATVEMPLSLSSVSAMYRHVNLASRIPGTTETVSDAVGEPANWPDAQTNDRHFAFIHGYKVDQAAAQGWHAEVFKRLHQLGSRARFIGLTWHGATGVDYHKAVYQAFVTSQHLAGELAAYGNLTIAAHSLGNLVVANAIQNHDFSPARFCMLNAALPIEALSAAQANADMQKRMTEKDWQDYPARLAAAHWHQLFKPGDNRSELTWKDRFENVTDVAYNFYSTGEDVLKKAEKGETLASGVWQNLFGGSEKGDKAWVLQEIGKGNDLLKLTSVDQIHGGWKINKDPDDLKHIGIKKSLPANGEAYRPRFASETSATVPTNEQLAQFGFFKRFNQYEDQSLYAPIDDANVLSGVTQTQAQASTMAGKDDTQWHLLAEAIPALSDAAGVASITGLQGNIDLKEKRNGWPASRGNNKNWLHSDCKKLSLNYVHKMYEEIISIGGLDNE